MSLPASSSGRDPTLPAAEAPSVEEAFLAEGTQVGEYEITGVLGEGGFGTVYGAMHPLIGKAAAVKVLSRQFSADPEMVSRFVAEARAANTIRHQNIIDVFSFGRLDDGRHYMVMELLEGASFERFLAEKGALEPPLVMALMRPVARALDAAHDKGVVHRDLKPDNIFITFDEDGRPVPKLLDFGIAKLLGDAGAAASHKTRTGVPVGTPHYMAPEQCLGEEVDAGVDVYAFGVVCFQCLTGERPFSAKNFLELMYRQTHADRPKVSERRPALGVAFDAAIESMMAIDKTKRPRTLVEAYGLLEQAARAAGYDVEAPLSPSYADLRPTGNASQRQGDGASASASTGAPASLAVPAEKGERRSAAGTAILIGGVLALAVVAYVASGSLLAQPAPTSPAAASASEAPPLSPSASDSAGAASAAAPAPAPSASAPAPDAAKTFVVTLEVSPGAAKARIFRESDDVELSCPDKRCELEGKQGDEVTLVLRAPGFIEAKKKLSLGADETVEVQLKGVPRPLNKDLEEAF